MLLTFLPVAYTLVYLPPSCGIVNRYLVRLLLYQYFISACATVVDKCQVISTAPLLDINHNKDTHFFLLFHENEIRVHAVGRHLVSFLCPTPGSC